MAYDTSKAGINAAENKQAGIIRDAKAGSPLGSSGTYSDVGNTASPDQNTIARNEINVHDGGPMPPGSTKDTGRMKP